MAWGLDLFAYSRLVGLYQVCLKVEVGDLPVLLESGGQGLDFDMDIILKLSCWCSS